MPHISLYDWLHMKASRTYDPLMQAMKRGVCVWYVYVRALHLEEGCLCMVRLRTCTAPGRGVYEEVWGSMIF